MYFEGLNSPFARFMENKIKYNLYITIEDILDNDLFDVTTHDNFYEVAPIFNFDSVTSSNPLDHVENNKTLILQKIDTTKLSFKSNMPIREFAEVQSITTIDNIKYTVYYTYDSTTSEPASGKMTSSGNTTDEHGYYVDSEVVTWL